MLSVVPPAAGSVARTRKTACRPLRRVMRAPVPTKTAVGTANTNKNLTNTPIFFVNSAPLGTSGFEPYNRRAVIRVDGTLVALRRPQIDAHAVLASHHHWAIL